jgi:hypothetical protein
MFQRQVGKLCDDGVGQLVVGQYQHMLARNQTLHAIECGLQHGSLPAHFQQLLGFDLAAGGPKAGAGATGHDYCMEHGIYLHSGFEELCKVGID